MSKKQHNAEAIEAEATQEEGTEVTIAPREGDGVIYAYIVQREDGYHVVDSDGTEGPVCKLVDEGDKTIALTKNSSNRKWYNRKKADELIAKDGSVPLYYKATRTIGTREGGTVGKSIRDPLARLVPYMTEEDKATYRAIVDKAVEALEAERKKPMTDLEKAQVALEKARAKYEALIAQQTGEATKEE